MKAAFEDPVITIFIKELAVGAKGHIVKSLESVSCRSLAKFSEDGVKLFIGFADYEYGKNVAITRQVFWRRHLRN